MTFSLLGRTDAPKIVKDMLRFDHPNEQWKKKTQNGISSDILYVIDISIINCIPITLITACKLFHIPDPELKIMGDANLCTPLPCHKDKLLKRCCNNLLANSLLVR